MRVRYLVLGLLVLLSVITYMDRICISVAGPRMQAEFGITPDQWGWVLGAFVLSYGLFEVPSGAWGDRFGQRGVLTRIVVWWSGFTVLTGLASNFRILLATRFLFGAGEAGAYVWGSMFYITWLPEYLVKGPGVSEEQMAVFASIPFVMGALGNLAGGFVSDRLSGARGLWIGRQLVGAACLALSALCLFATAAVSGTAVAVMLLAAGFGIMDGMLPCAWAMCADVGGRYAGAVSGAMNSAGQAGGFLCTVLFGYLVRWYGDYNVPLVVIGTMVLVSAVLFLLIDPTRPIVAEAETVPVAEEPVCA